MKVRHPGLSAIKDLSEATALFVAMNIIIRLWSSGKGRAQSQFTIIPPTLIYHLINCNGSIAVQHCSSTAIACHLRQEMQFEVRNETSYSVE